MKRQQKNHLRRDAGIGAAQIMVHCGDYKCGHSVTMYPALWPDDLRLSDRILCDELMAEEAMALIRHDLIAA